MPTLHISHEVDDVAHWLASTTREEVFAPIGVKVKTFTDPEGTNRVGLIAEVPDMTAFNALMQGPKGAEAMKNDGVRPETLVFLVEA